MSEIGVTRREALAGAAAMAALAGGRVAEAAVKPAGDLLAGHDALGLADLVRRREVSAAELLDLAIARCETLNPRLNFLTQKHYERARAALAAGLPAAAPEAPFRGVPWLLKDLSTYIEGEITSQGSRFYAGYRATKTSELVRRHEKAGLVIFGKTAAPEFGLTATTESKAHGLTRNPWNPEHSAGGSSGGAAVAVASGIVPAAHATDGGGSIRIPASCCGLFGLKPSRGRVPMAPPRTEGWGGMSVHHAVTRSVRDSAALLDATWGAEPGSRYVAPAPERPFLEEVGRPPGRLRIALSLKPAAGTPVDPEVTAAVQASARLCESLGHHVEETAPVLDLDAISRATIAIISTAVAVDLQDREAATGIKPSLETLETVTLAYYQLGLTIPGVAVTRGNNDLMATAITVARFMETYDLMLSPVVASPPPRLGVLGLSPPKLEDFYAAVAPYTPFASLANQTGLPAMSVPLGMSRAGLPIGVMFAARYGEEATLFRLAGQLEQAAPWSGRRPTV